MTVRIQAIHTNRISDKRQIFFNEETGEVESSSICWRQINGDHGPTIAARSAGNINGLATHIEIHGSLPKFLTGHNIFGSNNLSQLVHDTAKQLDKQLGIGIDEVSFQRILSGDFVVRRLDVANSLELPSEEDVRRWIKAMLTNSRTREGLPSLINGQTIYWQQFSPRWLIRGYGKREELRQNPLPPHLQETPLIRHSENKLRLELCMRSRELRERNMNTGKALTPKINSLLPEYLSRITTTGHTHLSDKTLHELPRALRATYLTWKSGEDMQKDLPASTFRRHRKGLRAHGIDIAIIAPTRDTETVVPLVRILEAKPSPIPSWAFSLGLVHPSARFGEV